MVPNDKSIHHKPINLSTPMKSLIYYLPLFLFAIIACDETTEYERLLQRELDSGIRQDSLFLGYYLGMPKQDFFDHSWELNQQKIVTGGTHVRYKMDNLSSNATMFFYPDFKDGRISRMPAEIHFDAWAIWNRELYSDSLIVELVELYEHVYGPGFIHTAHPDFEKVYRHDDMKARVEFLDLTAQ